MLIALYARGFTVRRTVAVTVTAAIVTVDIPRGLRVVPVCGVRCGVRCVV